MLAPAFARFDTPFCLFLPLHCILHQGQKKNEAHFVLYNSSRLSRFPLLTLDVAQHEKKKKIGLQLGAGGGGGGGGGGDLLEDELQLVNN